MAQKVKIDGLAEAVMKELTEYADLATVDMKSAVKKAGKHSKKARYKVPLPRIPALTARAGL